MTTIDRLAIEVWQGIFFYLECIQASYVRVALGGTIGKRLAERATEHLEVSRYEIDDEGGRKLRETVECLTSHSWLPKALLECRNMRSVSISTYDMPEHVHLMPQIEHYQAWGPTLTSLKLESPLLLFSLMSPLGRSVFPFKTRRTYQENLKALWKSLAAHDSLPDSVPASDWRVPYAHPCPDPAKLTNPWISLRELLPRLTTLHLKMCVPHTFYLAGAFTADYLAHLWMELPEALEELDHDLTVALHPLTLKYIPRRLKRYLSTSMAVCSNDERGSKDEGILFLPPDLEALIIPNTSLSLKSIPFLPGSLTRLHAKPAEPSYNNGIPSESSVHILNPNLRHLEFYCPKTKWTYHNNVKSLRLWLFYGFLGAQAISSIPNSLTSLTLLSLTFDPLLKFTLLPSTLEHLCIENLFKQDVDLQQITHGRTSEYRYKLRPDDLKSLPSSINHLELDYARLRPHQTPMTDRFGLKCIPCKGLTYLVTSCPFLVLDSPMVDLPDLRTLHLQWALYSSKALAGMTDLMLSKVSLPEQLLVVDTPAQPP